jgi:hypothetical protein
VDHSQDLHIQNTARTSERSAHVAARNAFTSYILVGYRFYLEKLLFIKIQGKQTMLAQYIDENRKLANIGNIPPPALFKLMSPNEICNRFTELYQMFLC